MAGSGLLRLLFLFTRDELHTRAGPTCGWRQSKTPLHLSPDSRISAYTASNSSVHGFFPVTE
ncbi:unnamed protein product [Ectocarpus sp. 8 AP-2014]